MYVINGNTLYLDEQLMCYINLFYVTIVSYGDAWQISWCLSTKTVDICIGAIRYSGVYTEIIDSSGDFSIKMEQIINMIVSKSVDEELCDYLKSVIDKTSFRYNILINHVYVLDENDNFDNVETLYFYGLKLKFTQQLKTCDASSHDMIKTQIFDVFISTLCNNIKSARK